MSVKPGPGRTPALAPPGRGATCHFVGPLQARIEAVVLHFDTSLPAANPQLLECFRTRNSKSFSASAQGLTVPWSGEYPGKWLTHCAELWRITHDRLLKASVDAAIQTLSTAQAPDGYLSPWGDDDRWSGAHWDTWAHYHLMYGCLLWADATGDPTALLMAAKMAACICNHFTSAHILSNQGGIEQNMAILHSVACLYSRTKDPKLLAFCNIVLQELERPEDGHAGPDYLRNALKDQPYFKGQETVSHSFIHSFIRFYSTSNSQSV